MKNFGKRVFTDWPDQNMDMIGHHYEMAKPITLFVEKSQRFLNNS